MVPYSPKMSVSIHAVLNLRRVRKDGRAAIYLRVVIDRRFKDIALELAWYPELWKNESCQKRQTPDKEADDFNLIIQAAKARAHEVFVQYRLRNLHLSLDTFLKEYKSNLNRDDFLVYYRQKLLQRLKEKEITASSAKNHTVTLRYLERWRKSILFSELDERAAIRFDEFLGKKTGCGTINGRWGHHKNFKTYLNFAKKDKIVFVHPYDYFTAKQTMGRYQPMTAGQLADIWEAYKRHWYAERERASVRAFLFACFTGMRHSDVRRVSVEWIDGHFLEFVPWKTRKHGTVVRVPMVPEALDLLREEIGEHGKERIFRSISEQKQNQVMRKIGVSIGYRGNLCFQVARETFATLYMEGDGKLEVLASFLGHTSTQMSEKYIKIRDARKQEEAAKISAFVRSKK